MFLGFLLSVYNHLYYKEPFFLDLIMTQIFAVVCTIIISTLVIHSYKICPPVIKCVEEKSFSIEGYHKDYICNNFVVGCNIKSQNPKLFFKNKYNVLCNVSAKDVRIIESQIPLYVSKTTYMMTRKSNWLLFGGSDIPNLKKIESILYVPENYTIVNCIDHAEKN